MTRIHGAWVSITITGVVGTYQVLAKVDTCYLNIMAAIQKGVIDKEAIQREISDQKADFITLKSECNDTHRRQDDRIERYFVKK